MSREWHKACSFLYGGVCSAFLSPTSGEWQDMLKAVARGFVLLSVCVVLGMVILQSKSYAQARMGQCATFDASSGGLHIPCFRISDSLYSIDLVLNASGLNLVKVAAAVDGESVYYCSKYNTSNNTLRIPCIAVGSSKYWADLTLSSTSPLTFQLKDYGTAFSLPLLYNAGVTPVEGNASTLFTFYVSYYDKTGTPPALSSVITDGVQNSMTLMQGTASNGVYAASLFLTEGSHSFVVLFAEGTTGRPLLLDYGDMPRVTGNKANSPPSLLQASLQPVHGNELTVFGYSVNYFDPDGNPPVESQVIVNEGLSFPMTLAGGSGDNGLYRADLSLRGGCYCYRFLFSDGAERTSFPSFGGFHGPAVNSIDTRFSPAIDRPVTCDTINVNPELFNGSLTPLSGDQCTLFTFQVDYFDFDGGPSGVYAYIDEIPFGMSLKSGTPSNGTYVLTTQLPPGDHSFYFYADDGRCGAARYPLKGSLQGPHVTAFSPAGLPCPVNVSDSEPTTPIQIEQPATPRPAGAGHCDLEDCW